MIKSIVHARKVQAKRALSRKHGYARAVIRYLLREHLEDFARVKATLPVYHASKEKDEEPSRKPKKFEITGWMIATRLTSKKKQLPRHTGVAITQAENISTVEGGTDS